MSKYLDEVVDALVSTLRSMSSSSSSSRVESNTTEMDTDGCVFCFLRIVGSWKVFFCCFFHKRICLFCFILFCFVSLFVYKQLDDMLFLG